MIEREFNIRDYEYLAGYPIQINKTFMDESYGRPLRPSHLKRITANWNWNLLEQPLLSDRKPQFGFERYAIIDGNHRLKALTERGVTETYCRVLFDLTIQEEAMLFRQINTLRVRPNAPELFKVDIRRGDKDALATKKLLDKYGIIIGPNVTSGNQLNCIKLVRTLYKRTPQLLEDVFETLEDVWATPLYLGTYTTTVITGVYSLLAGVMMLQSSKKKSIFDTDRMLEKLKQHTPSELLIRTKGITLGGLYSNKLGTGVNPASVQIMLEWYNKNLPTGKRIEVGAFPTAFSGDWASRIKELLEDA